MNTMVNYAWCAVGWVRLGPWLTKDLVGWALIQLALQYFPNVFGISSMHVELKSLQSLVILFLLSYLDYIKYSRTDFFIDDV